MNSFVCKQTSIPVSSPHIGDHTFRLKFRAVSEHLFRVRFVQLAHPNPILGKLTTNQVSTEPLVQITFVYCRHRTHRIGSPSFNNQNLRPSENRDSLAKVARARSPMVYREDVRGKGEMPWH
jgi:hypothetical protein